MSETTDFDLDAYCTRIGYAGEWRPTLTVLQSLVTYHTEVIAYENLNPFLSQPVKIDVASLQEKMIYSGRGGYCYEQNGLLRAALEALGFSVIPLAARVVLGRDAFADAPLTHQILQVNIDQQPYLVDVGFGGMTSPSPLLLLPDIVQETTHEPYRLLLYQGVYVLESMVQEEWRPMYRFTLEVQEQIDYEMGNWFVSTHPKSGFVTGLSAARLAKGKRYALRDGRFSIHTVGQESEIHELTESQEVIDVLQNVMGLTIPEGWGLEARVNALLTQPAPAIG